VPSAHRAKRDGKPVFDRSDRHRPAPSTPVTHLRQLSSRLDYEARGDVDERRADPQGAAHRVTRAEVPFISRSIGDSNRGPTVGIIIDEPTAAGRRAGGGSTPPSRGSWDRANAEEFVGIVAAPDARSHDARQELLAFTAAEEQTLEMFGERYVKGDAPGYPPFHTTDEAGDRRGSSSTC